MTSDEVTAMIIVSVFFFAFGCGIAILIGQEAKLMLHVRYWRWRGATIPNDEITGFQLARAFLEHLGYGIESSGNSRWYVDAPGNSDIEQWTSEDIISEAIEKRAHLLILARKRKRR